MKALAHSMTFASPLNKFLVIFEPQLVVVCCCLVTKSYPTLYDPMDCSLGLLHCRQTLYCLSYKGSSNCSPPDSSVHGISLARILEWVAVSLFRGSSRPKD